MTKSKIEFLKSGSSGYAVYQDNEPVGFLNYKSLSGTSAAWWFEYVRTGEKLCVSTNKNANIAKRFCRERLAK